MSTPRLEEKPVLETRCQCHLHNGEVVAAVYRHADDITLWYESIGFFVVTENARCVDIFPAPHVDEQLLSLALVSRVATYVLQRLGYPSLHASAVVVGQSAATFLGGHGQGKSTMAACFLRRGTTLLTDDVLPLQVVGGDVYGGPSLPIMKLWKEAAVATLQLHEDLPSLPSMEDKKLVDLDGRYELAQAPVRMGAVYVLDRYDPTVSGRTDIVINRLSQRESLTTFIAQTYGRESAQPKEWARFMPIYARLAAQAPVRVLSYPHGFAYQEAVYCRLLEDIEAAS